MDSRTLNQFRSLLQSRHKDLFEQIARNEQQTRATADRQPEDSGDMSTKSVERDLLFATTDSNHRMLRLIDAALKRVRQSTFGMCMGCGHEISMQRLKAVPWALYCIKCQNRAEKRLAAVT